MPSTASSTLRTLAVLLGCVLAGQASADGNGTTFYTTADTIQVGQPVELVATAPAGLTLVNRFDFYGDTEDFFTSESLCENVTATTIGNQWTARCTATFAEARVHYLYAAIGTPGSNERSSAGTYVVQNVVASTPFDANQFALTGSWYNPPTSGQGLEIQVYPDLHGAGAGRVFVGWFTYDASGNPQWVTLEGELASSHGSSYELTIYQNTGGNFNASPATQSVVDGTATLTFYDCGHAALTYHFNDGRTGTIAYVRLTASSACSSAVPAVAPAQLPANQNDVLHSGAWFNPATSGQGLAIDIVPAQTTFFAAWYTYAPQTEGITGLLGQRWFILWDPAYTPGDLHLDHVAILATSGGIFNVPSDVPETQVGTADITFTSCNTMTLKYNFTQGEFNGLSGTINEQTVVPVSGCQ
ncbi:MAG: hypothetical protein ACREPN_12910 [Rudaea sp.]